MSSNSQNASGTGGSSSSNRGRNHIQNLKMLANGRYRVMNQVGRGGMSVVYHAYDSQNDRDVAIKILALDLALEEDFLARFQRESELMRDLSHPNVLRAYDYGQDDQFTYLVMSFYGGGTLKERIKGPVPLQSIAQYLSQVAAGLGYAHSRNIVHRDVKPSNVLIHHASDNLVLSDFGIAKALSNANSQRTGTIMGTPLYMAPEQFLDRVDQRTDIYALGIMLYQMLTGEVPFKGEGIGYKHLNEPVPPLAAFGTNYPPAIEQVVMKALAKQPQARFQYVQEMAQAFSQAVQEFGQASNPAVLEQATSIIKVNPLVASKWDEQVRQPMLPGQANFGQLPVLEPGQLLPGPPYQIQSHNTPSAPTPPPVMARPPQAHDTPLPYQPLAHPGPDNGAKNYRQPDPNPLAYNRAAPTPTPAPYHPETLPPPAYPYGSDGRNGQNGQKSSSPKKPRWWLVALLVVIILGLGAGSAGLLYMLLGTSSVKATPTVVGVQTTSAVTLSPTIVGVQTTPAVTTAPATSNPTQPAVGAAKQVQVLYVSQLATDTKAIFSWNNQDGSRRALTTFITGTQDTNPVWAVNGQTVVFQSDRDGGRAALYKMSAQGIAPTKFVDDAYSPSVSHAGNRIAYVSSKDNNIYLINNISDPTHPTQITNDSAHKKLGPMFSPDDSQLAFSMENTSHIYQIYLLDLNNLAAPPKNLVPCEVQHCVYPVFSPDGTKIVYNTTLVNPNDDADRTPLDVYTVATDGKSAPRQLTQNAGHNSRPLWIQDNRGPDGTRIYFNSDRGDGNWARIFVMNDDGTSQKLLIPDTDGSSQKNVDDYAPNVLTQ